MNIDEIKEHAKYLDDEQKEKIRQEIKSKEEILKSGNISEEELNKVIDTFFSILVIENILESEVEEIEDIRDQLKDELMEAYGIYDNYIEKYKRESKKNKKRWLFKFLFLSEDITKKKQTIGKADKKISELKEQINDLKETRRDDNLKRAVDKNYDDKVTNQKPKKEGKRESITKPVTRNNKETVKPSFSNYIPSEELLRGLNKITINNVETYPNSNLVDEQPSSIGLRHQSELKK